MSTYEFDTTVLGGLPVTIEFTTTGYDNRDVGLGVDDVDEWYVVAVNGVYRKNLQWIENRIYKTKGEEDRIIQACYDHKDD
jgi:hypothetical protein